ncbi:MAG: thioredoxin domain-containing protein [Proteobacteria bacterium]|nr:thioredoxin domain-containing protein [Pseudomonadota bacterium]
MIAGNNSVAGQPARDSRRPNRLLNEKSPYLLQHAYNPVDWYPWGEEAFEKARRENKPIFLSIGYSTCHWCHVMERESFEDPEIARLMNAVFVSVKVDREERPDIDNIYMTVCQLMTGSGGWPLTIVMTPDKEPFFAATYIPQKPRFGRPGMLDLIPRIKEAWELNRDDLDQTASRVIAAVQAESLSQLGGNPGEESLHLAFRQLAGRYDGEYGGFGRQMKFPSTHQFLFLLRFWKRTGNNGAIEMVEKTLNGMRHGGIYDHLGFGFHRYSTDPEWLVPHFEKMLYDQALLIWAYTEAFQVTGNALYLRTANEIITYVLRDLYSPEGAFYSAEDADSEGVEGKFYVWTEEEVLRILGREEGKLLVNAFRITGQGNFREESTGQYTGANILHLDNAGDEKLVGTGLFSDEDEERLQRARETLFSEREKRIRPFRDDKVLTDWNGLMIGVLAKAGAILGEPGYVKAAQKAAWFISKELTDPGGRLFHRYRHRAAGLMGHLDDYAFFVFALIELYQATFDPSYLEKAVVLNDTLIKHFWDTENGAFYLTADDAEKLLVRSKEFYDGAIPSGNSVAAYNLLRLARLTGRDDLEEKASTIARAFGEDASTRPDGFTMFLSALDFAIGPSVEVVISGEKDGSDTKIMLAALKKTYIPNMVVIQRSDDSLETLKEVAPFVVDQPMLKGKATAYVCVNHSCSFPTTSSEEMLKLITERTRSKNSG